VQRLARSGLADRRPSRDDGRVVMVSASEAGRRRHEAIALYRRAFMTDVLSEFDEVERAQLADLLERLVRSVDRAAASREPVGEPGP
jgi:DNA-binding MarR family transcriptional regulator